MSLFRRLWLVVAGTTLLAFAGSFVVSVLTARSYLEQQLHVQAMDSAASLALSMSQPGNQDAVSRELLLSALFDSGHFRELHYLDAQGRRVVERINRTRIDTVPGWFSALVPLQAKPGRAQVSSGWQQAGTVILVGDTRFAHAALWQGTLRLLAWIAAAGLLTGLLGSLLLRAIRQPLDRVVEQAQAITERRFITLELPRIPELRSMVAALNSMVERLRLLFAEQTARIQALQQEAHGDGLTGLANRGWLDSRLAAALADEDAAAEGCLVWLHLHGLQRFNEELGHDGGDRLLRSVGDLLREQLAGHHDRVAARATGAEFLLLAPGLDAAAGEAVGDTLMRRLLALLEDGFGRRGNLAHVGVAHYRHGQTPEAVREQAGLALEAAIAAGDNTVARRDLPADTGDGTDLAALLRRGYAGGGFHLQAFPVVRADGRLLHDEVVLRLRHPDSGEILSAGRFMPTATRLGLSPGLDLEAARQALAHIRHSGRPAAINLAIESAAAPDFQAAQAALLQGAPDVAGRLWVEVGEHGLAHELRLLRQLADTLRPTGCHLGIDHFGRHLSCLPHLHELGLDYLKIDSGLVAGVDRAPGQQALVGAIASVAQALGLLTIAERVQTAAEREALAGLGVSGLTGPIVGEVR